MKNNKSTPISPTADRMGRFIGQLRNHEGITLGQLARGLCSSSHLGRIENGEREVGKQMTDALFQRLGKPAELFERILDWGEFQRWTRRQEIISRLHRGEVEEVRTLLKKYLPKKPKVLDRQFAAIVEINCCHLSGASADELLPMVRDALLLTQPKLQTTPIQKLLLSQNEGRLLFAYLQLREKLEGFALVERDYNALLSCFKHPRYESRERVYLVPYVACRVIECEYLRGNFQTALEICEDTLAELAREEWLFACENLLSLKQRLFDAMGNPDRTPERLLEQLRAVRLYGSHRSELFISCEESGHVYCINHLIRDRRKLLGITQEKLAEGICESRTLSRIECKGGNLQRKNRKMLLQRVNMSGERYDYEVITDRYEDYLLRSELNRALVAKDSDAAEKLLFQLRQRVLDLPENQQHIIKCEARLFEIISRRCNATYSENKIMEQLSAALELTLPLELQDIADWSTCILTINEILILISYAFCCKRLNMYEKSLQILTYIQRCLENTGTDVSYYEDLYTRVGVSIASVLSDMGRYERSDMLIFKCMELCLESQDARRLPRCLFGVAWNLTQRISECSEHEKAQKTCEAITLLEQAYAVAILSGNVTRQQEIAAYCNREYRVDVTAYLRKESSSSSSQSRAQVEMPVSSSQ